MNRINIQTNGNKEASNENVVAGGLSQVLAESYVLYLKTHNFHWNVTGSMFQPLHSVFEGQYTALAEAVDEIAKRIRALGVPAPGSFSEFQCLSSIEEASGKPRALEMSKNFWTVMKRFLKQQVKLLSLPKSMAMRELPTS